MVQKPLLYVKNEAADDQLPGYFGQLGWDVSVATHPAGAVQLMRQREFRVGLVHLDLVNSDAQELRLQAESLIGATSHINWIAILPFQSGLPCRISQFIATHFYDFHTLPLDPERLLVTVGHAYGMAAISKSREQECRAGSEISGFVGQTPCMRALFQMIRKFSQIDFNVMIRGESGTGKELTAQAIHRLSNRSNGPFVAVNCGALPKDLIQAELFGHEKGSFTGADRRRVGRIEAAQNGTLFLDEIGDLPLELQVNLLRFLQEKTIDRVGGSTQISVDVRVIAATNVDLERAVEEGRFREDLYYRLNVLHLDMPALRERDDDIELLANHFLEKFAQTIKPNLRGFNQQAIDTMKTYPWPGNVREMVNRIQRAVVMCEGRLIKPRDLGLDRDVPNLTVVTLAEARARAEKAAIETTLAVVRNNVSRAAKQLDISRVTLYRLMEQYAVDWQKSKDG